MEFLSVKTLPDGSEEFEIDLTDEEREMIKKSKGWSRLTRKRIQTWFIETLENTLDKEEEKTKE